MTKELSRQSSIPEQYLKRVQTIDADSISLASLSESPPSEFKFSDDEENTDEIDEHLNQALHGISLTRPKKPVNTVPQSQPINKNTATTPTTTAAAELSKNFQQQQLKLNQMNLIRNRKKNFHSVLLKDSKRKLLLFKKAWLPCFTLPNQLCSIPNRFFKKSFKFNNKTNSMCQSNP